MQPNALQGMPLVGIPSIGTTGGRPRKEAIYDRECYPSGSTVATSLKVFNSFGSFANAPATVALTKQEGRDTNLSGSGGVGLPNNHLFHWFAWRHAMEALGVDLADDTYKGVSEEIQRIIGLSYCEFRFTQTTLITAPMAELPAGRGPAWGSTTHTDTTVYGPNGLPNRQGKVITVAQSPVVIRALQQFGVTNKTPEPLAIQPTTDIFSQHILDGVLVRAVTG